MGTLCLITISRRSPPQLHPNLRSPPPPHQCPLVLVSLLPPTSKPPQSRFLHDGQIISFIPHFICNPFVCECPSLYHDVEPSLLWGELVRAPEEGKLLDEISVMSRNRDGDMSSWEPNTLSLEIVDLPIGMVGLSRSSVDPAKVCLCLHWSK